MRRRSSLGARCVSVCACVQGLRVCCLLCERYGFFSCCCCFAPNLFCCLDALRSFASAGINKRVQLGLPAAVPRRVRAHMHVTHTHTRTRPVRLLCLGRHRGAGAGECGAVRWIKSAGRDCVQTKGQERPRGGGQWPPSSSLSRPPVLRAVGRQQNKARPPVPLKPPAVQKKAPTQKQRGARVAHQKKGNLSAGGGGGAGALL